MHDTFSHPPPKNFIRTINYRKKLNAEIFHESQKKEEDPPLLKICFLLFNFFCEYAQKFSTSRNNFC